MSEMKNRSLGIGNQIILGRTGVIAILAGFAAYTGIAVLYHWGEQNIEGKDELLMHALLILLTLYFVRQFLSGKTMTVGAADFAYDEDDTNIVMRWAIFLFSLAYLLFLPLVIG